MESSVGVRKERRSGLGRWGREVGEPREGDRRPGGVCQVENGEAGSRDGGRGALGGGKLLGSRTSEEYRALDMD